MSCNELVFHQEGGIICKKTADIIVLQKQIADLTACLKLADEKLEFYGGAENWEDCWIDGCAGSEDYFTSIKGDMGGRVGGWRAREYLQSTEREAVKELLR